MNLGVGGSSEGHCRIMAFVPDLRALYPDLNMAMKTGGMVKPFNGLIEPGQRVAGMREMVRKTDHHSV